MDSLGPRRVLGFVAALAVLAGGTLAISLAGGDSPASGLRRTHLLTEPDVAATLHRPRPARRAGGAGRVAAEFARVYLVYEAGQIGRGVREFLTRLCSHQFAVELLRSPVRLPPGAGPPRERLLGLPILRSAVVEGTAGLLASARLMRESRDEWLIFSLAPRGGRWRVIGVGR